MLDTYEARARRGTPHAFDRAVLVCLDFGQDDFDEALAEFRLLAASAGLTEAALVRGRRQRPDPALFAGAGKIAEVAAAVTAGDAGVVLVNHVLSPAQQRNIEREVGARVVDRTALILDIFAQRAKSHEGKIQVELAQLRHLATRLVRGWTHLERQKGGIGLRGPGETQLETDRRLIGERVKLLSERLAKVGRQRDVQRRARSRGRVFSVSLVGYTNAGKSTLFNALTKAQSYAADQLFATLDTTSRRLHLAADVEVVVSDTVGFIRDLPHTLVAAFRATLEETVQADLLLHVVDSASPARLAQIDQVNGVLAEIGAAQVPQIMVWNKIDLPGADGALHFSPGIERDEYGKIERLYVSARTRQGLDLLREALIERARQAERGSGAGHSIAAAEATGPSAASAF
ncbi:MAG: GTPase HflX [Burkholderiales bacterium]|nr:GTPase HflX [Burkholderiales bacterium]